MLNPPLGVVILSAGVTLKNQGNRAQVLHMVFIENTPVLEKIIARSRIQQAQEAIKKIVNQVCEAV
jgi:hypothetical protein